MPLRHHAAMISTDLSRRTLMAGMLTAASPFMPVLAQTRVAPPIATSPVVDHLPRRSDVIFSARWAKPEALLMARSFGATRLDWCYSSDAGFFRDARAAGLATLGGTVNANLPDGLGQSSYRLGRIMDQDGKLLTAPWMRSWGVIWGCANAPEYRASWLAHALATLGAGADVLMMDDPAMNVAALPWGGCWCPHCRSRAALEGVELNRDMRTFQTRSVSRFFTDMRAELDCALGRRVAMSSNNFGGRLDWPANLFDFGIAELPPNQATAAHISLALRAAEARGFKQIFTLASSDVALNRRAAAWCYANGGHLVVPWDVFLRPNATGSDRFFGRLEDFGPIYRFVRKLGPLLDDAVDAGPAEGAVLGAPPGLGWALRASDEGQFAVLHLVHWEAEIPFKLRLDLARVPYNAGVVMVPDGTPVALRLANDRLEADLPAAPWYAVVLKPP